MSDLTYITENEVRVLIEGYLGKNADKKHIINSPVFVQHHVDTGRIAYDVAKRIVENHPGFVRCLYPDLLRVEGNLHDLNKVTEGGPYHEIGTAHLILTRGEEFGLVRGGSEEERRESLRTMALLPISDHSTYEQLGGRVYPDPDAALYGREVFDRFYERVEYLRRELSKTGKTLTLEDLTLPCPLETLEELQHELRYEGGFKKPTHGQLEKIKQKLPDNSLNRMVALYADLTNFKGGIVSVEERLKEIIERYSDHERPYYHFDPHFACATELLKPRALVIEAIIKGLLEQD